MLQKLFLILSAILLLPFCYSAPIYATTTDIELDSSGANNRNQWFYDSIYANNNPGGKSLERDWDYFNGGDPVQHTIIAYDNLSDVGQADKKVSKDIYVTESRCYKHAIDLLTSAIITSIWDSSINWERLLTLNYPILVCAATFLRTPKLVTTDNMSEVSMMSSKAGDYIEYDEQSKNFITTDKYDKALNTFASPYVTLCTRSPFAGILGNGFNQEGNFYEEEKDRINRTSNSALYKLFLAMSGPIQCTANASETGSMISFANNIYNIFEAKGDEVCVELVGTNLGGVNNIQYFSSAPLVGCQKMTYAASQRMCAASTEIIDKAGNKEYDNSLCFNTCVAEQCWNKSMIHSRSQIPIFAEVASCFQESVDNVLRGCVSYDGRQTTSGMLINAQKHLQNAIKIVVTIAIMLFGIKMMMSMQFKLSDFVMFLIKVSIVLTLTMPNGTIIKYQNLLNGMGDSLTAIVLNTSNIGNGHCNFFQSDIQYDQISSAGGKKFDFDYLRLWDLLDCKFQYYLGSKIYTNDPTDQPAKVSSDGLTCEASSYFQKSKDSESVFGFLSVFPQALFSNILMFFIGAALVILMFSAMLWFVQIVLISYLARAFVVLLSPITIPMMLFQNTKPTFDGWLKQVVAFTLLPAFIGVALAIFINVVDIAWYGNTSFEMIQDALPGDSKNVGRVYYRPIVPTAADLDCEAPGIQMNAISLKSTDLFFFKVSSMEPSGWTMLLSIVKLAISIVILVIFFFTIYPGMVAMLLGGNQSVSHILQSAENPLLLVQGAFSVAKGVASAGKNVAKMGSNLAKKQFQQAAKGAGEAGKGALKAAGNAANPNDGAQSRR